MSLEVNGQNGTQVFKIGREFVMQKAFLKQDIELSVLKKKASNSEYLEQVNL